MLYRVGISAAMLTVAGCSSSPGVSAAPGGAPYVSDAATTDVRGNEDAGGVEAATAPALTLSLDPTIDQPDDDAKAISIADARLFDETGLVKSVAALASNGAVFALTGIAPGDYFIEINGDADDLVPTRIDDPKSSLTQRVGQKLRASYIGPANAPTYRINTYSTGQKESPVVGYSDGAVIPGEQPYVIYSFSSSQLEIRLLGSAAPLTALALPRCVGHAYDPADAWLLNTTNQDHHGDLFNADGGAGECQTCHWYGAMKKYTLGALTPTDGWCYRCHYGTAGSRAGFVDPTK
jgi:hypothetical protein